MKVGVVVYSGDAETVWNAIRFGNFVMSMGDQTTTFLLGKGVELESLKSGKFNIAEQLNIYRDLGGKIFACGTCLEIHHIQTSNVYTVATMKDLYEIIKESDKVVSF